MTTDLPSRPRGLALCAALLAMHLAAPDAGAAPMRVSVDGLAAPDVASSVPNDPPPAQFVQVGPPVVLDKDDPDVPLIRSQELPSAVQAAPVDAQAVPEESVALGREARDPLPADEGAAESERRLGGFAGLAVQPAERQVLLTAAPAGADPFEETQAEAESTTGPVAAMRLPTLQDLEQLREQRQALQWVVVPLVLVAMAIAWFTSTRRRPRKTRREGGERRRGRRRRHGAVHAAR